MSVTLFTRDVAAEILDASRRFLNRPTDSPAHNQPPTSSPYLPTPICVVEVTSATTTNSLYPATVQMYDAATPGWSALGTVWAVGINGETLTASTRYEGRGIATYNNVPVYGVTVPGSGGFTFSGASSPFAGSPATISPSTLTTLVWNTVVFDTNSYFGPTQPTTTLTIPATGKYLITCTVTFGSAGVNEGTYRLLQLANANPPTTTYGMAWTSPVGAGGFSGNPTTCVVTTILSLTSGTSMVALVEHDATTAMAIGAVGPALWSIYRLDP